MSDINADHIKRYTSNHRRRKSKERHRSRRKRKSRSREKKYGRERDQKRRGYSSGGESEGREDGDKMERTVEVSGLSNRHSCADLALAFIRYGRVEYTKIKSNEPLVTNGNSIGYVRFSRVKSAVEAIKSQTLFMGVRLIVVPLNLTNVKKERSRSGEKEDRIPRLPSKSSSQNESRRKNRKRSRSSKKRHRERSISISLSSSKQSEVSRKKNSPPQSTAFRSEDTQERFNFLLKNTHHTAINPPADIPEADFRPVPAAFSEQGCSPASKKSRTISFG